MAEKSFILLHVLEPNGCFHTLNSNYYMCPLNPEFSMLVLINSKSLISTALSKEEFDGKNTKKKMPLID
ncbi:hypothetical protein SLE2022_076480 [Rubroshorea leprosula]